MTSNAARSHSLYTHIIRFAGDASCAGSKGGREAQRELLWIQQPSERYMTLTRFCAGTRNHVADQRLDWVSKFLFA